MSSEPLAAEAADRAGSALAGEQIYRLSAAGRRTALILLLGVAAVWIFALWTLITQAQDGLNGPEWVTAVLMLGILVVAPVVGWNLLEERAVTITTDATGLTYRSLNGIALAYAWPEITGVGEPATAPSRWARLFMDDSAPETAPSTMEQSLSAGRKADENQQSNHNIASPTVTRDDPAETPAAPADAEDRDQDAYETAQRTIPLQVVPPPPARIGNQLIRALWQQAHGATLPLPGELERRDALLALIRAHRLPLDSPPPA